MIFLPLQPRLIAESWAVWKGNNSSGCLKRYIQIVKELSYPGHLKKGSEFV